jgi:hypothetical protein
LEKSEESSKDKTTALEGAVIYRSEEIDNSFWLAQDIKCPEDGPLFAHVTLVLFA